MANESDIPLVEVSFKRVPEIAAYLRSVQHGDDGVLKLRLTDMRNEHWTKAEWNAFGISARVALINHPAYAAVLQVIQEKGGI